MEFSIRDASDEALTAELERLRRCERERLPDILACLSEVERRGIHVDLSYRTLFDYCVIRLRYSEGAAARRIYSARAASRFPALSVLIRDGELSLTAVSRLEPHLTKENFDSVVARAAGKRQREIEDPIVEIVAEKNAAASRMASESHEPMPADIPLFEAADAMPASPAAAVVLKRSCASGLLEEILERVIDEFLARNDPSRRRAATPRPPRLRQTRKIPRWVKDRVWRRDEGRCSFAAPDGRRCGARGGLEFDHIVPWARGGSSDDPQNIRLLCRAHNLRRARRMFDERVPSAVRPSP